MVWSFDGAVCQWDDSIAHVNFRELEGFVVDYIELIRHTRDFVEHSRKTIPFF